MTITARDHSADRAPTAPASEPIRRRDTALVVGGGIAGLSCALRLAENGIAVTLLETRKKLGGRATSFKDTRSGEVLDNCQHVVLGCCTNYMDLLTRLGVADRIRFYREQYWVEQGGQASVIKRGVMPAPFHFGASFLRAPFLSFSEASSIGRCCMRMLSTDRSKHKAITFGAWLRAHGQTDAIIRRFWEPVVVSACNLCANRVSAESALHVFQEGFLAHAHAADLGVSTVPLVSLYDAAAQAIESRGGKIVFGAGAQNITTARGETVVTTTSGETFSAQAGICAVPVERVNRIVAIELRRHDPRFDALDQFSHSPILGVHLRFDRSVMGDLPHAVLVERATQWLFRKDDEGKYLHAVVSAADDWLGLSEAQIASRVLADIHACFPKAQDAKLESVRAVTEKLATFAPVPGLETLRPSCEPPESAGKGGLVLAGDYTNTGWPATMEGATRSGYAAAAAVLGRPASAFLVPSLSVAPLSRMLGLKARDRELTRVEAPSVQVV